MKPKPISCLLLNRLVLSTLAVIVTQAAQESPGSTSALRDWAEGDHLFGTWGGLRTDLSKHGVDFEFLYAGSLPSNLSGGLRTGSAYQGGLLMTLDLDSQKLAGYAGGTFHAGGLWLHGQKPFSASYVGDLNRVNLLDFPNAARLWDLWYQQKFLDDRFALKLGVLSIDHDFIVPEYFNQFGQVTLINQTFFYPTLPYSLFDVPGLPPRGHGLPATPLTAPGAVLRWNASPPVYLQAGVYGGTPDQTGSGTQFPLRSQDGVLTCFEAGYQLNQSTNEPGLAGSYKVGAYYHGGDFVDLYEGVMGAFYGQAGLPVPPARDHAGNFGAYLLAEQQLFRETAKRDPAQQGLVAFFRLLGAPADRNLTQLETDGGLVYRGLVPGRDWDTTALAVSYLGISDDFRRAQRDINALAPGAVTVGDHETVLEASYKLQATAWFTVQASLQRVFHPGGSAAIPDATVLILQSTVRF